MTTSQFLRRAAVNLSIGGSLLASTLFAQTVQIAQNTAVTGSYLPSRTKAAGSPQVVALGDTFLTVGNTYAALSKDQGQTWTYHNPNTRWPSSKGIIGHSMRLVKPRTYDMALWVMAEAPANGSTSNKVRVAVSRGKAQLQTMTFKAHELSATALGASNGQWVKIQDVATDDHWLYLSLTTIGGGFYKGSSVARLSLKNLFEGNTPHKQLKVSATMKGGYYGFARGCTDSMYFASVGNATTMRVFRWSSSSTVHSATDRTISRWYSGFSLSKLKDGKNWLGGDNRTIQTGYKLGNEVVFLFDSNKGGAHKNPFIRVSRFRTSNLSLVKEHNISHSNHAWAFPSVTVGANNTIAFSAYIGGAFVYPTMMVGFVDGLNNWDWDKLNTTIARYSFSSPHNQQWGFRSNVIEHPSFPGSFLAAGQVMTSAGNADVNCEHRVVWFSRTNKRPSRISLTVSSSPVTGVPVSMNVKDIQGNQNGSTSFSRSFWTNQGYELRAPVVVTRGANRYVFSRWQLAGVDQKLGDPVLSVKKIGVSPNQAKALYKAGYALSLQSNNAANAPFTLSIADASGQQNGRTNTTRVYAKDSNVTIRYNSYVGARKAWRLTNNNVTFAPSATTITVKMDRARTIRVTYGYRTDPTTASFGQSCTGTNGKPSQLVSGRPEIGEIVTHTVTKGVRNGNALGVAGFSRTDWNGASLPYTFPGSSCKVLIAPMFYVATGLDSFGKGSIPVRVPHNRDLIGMYYYTQFAIHDPSTPLGLTTTNALQVKIGGWNVR